MGSMPVTVALASYLISLTPRSRLEVRPPSVAHNLSPSTGRLTGGPRRTGASIDP